MRHVAAAVLMEVSRINTWNYGLILSIISAVRVCAKCNINVIKNAFAKTGEQPHGLRRFVDSLHGNEQSDSGR